jgi:hypothetical protein
VPSGRGLVVAIMALRPAGRGSGEGSAEPSPLLLAGGRGQLAGAAEELADPAHRIRRLGRQSRREPVIDEE